MDSVDVQLLPAKVTEWFPLVPRPRPPCRALRQRVAEVRDLARSASNTEKGLALAAESLNKAALIASDCGLTDLARRLCWRQFDVFQAGVPLSATDAKYALQPIVNLGRLLTRGGHGERAYQVYRNTFDAVATASATAIDGRGIDFGPLVNQDHERRELTTFLWTVLLADGTRALIHAGRWHDALRHLEQQKGIGKRMLDGRQVAILERCSASDHDGALYLLNDSAVSDPWEQVIAAFLRALCTTTAKQPATAPVTNMVDAFLNLGPTPGHPVFRIRLGLCMLDIAPDSGAPHLAARITHEALTSTDAYIARDVLSHHLCRSSMSEADRTTLTATVQDSGLNRGIMPAHLLDELMSAVQTSEAQLVRRQ